MRFFIESPDGTPVRSVEELYAKFPKLRELNIVEEIKTEEVVLPTIVKGENTLAIVDAKRVVLNVETPLKIMDFIDATKMNVSLRYQRAKGNIRPNYRVMRLMTPFD